MESTHEKNQNDIKTLRLTIGEQLEAMNTLTTGARDAVASATYQTDAMNDEIGKRNKKYFSRYLNRRLLIVYWKYFFFFFKKNKQVA